MFDVQSFHCSGQAEFHTSPAAAKTTSLIENLTSVKYISGRIWYHKGLLAVLYHVV